MNTLRLHEITIDCSDAPAVAAFWTALLGGELSEPLPGWRRLSAEGRPMLNFQPVPETKIGKSRVHLDLLTEDLDADPEGTESCVVAYR